MMRDIITKSCVSDAPCLFVCLAGRLLVCLHGDRSSALSAGFVRPRPSINRTRCRDTMKECIDDPSTCEGMGGGMGGGGGRPGGPGFGGFGGPRGRGQRGREF
eukprot:SAG11_NODE_3488_length_2417_cov_1.083261_2_plen_103_part_00